MLKVRIQNPSLKENDFIEIELDRQELTYKELLRVSCHELGVNPEHVQKIRKLPNTMLRKVRTLHSECSSVYLKKLFRLPLKSTHSFTTCTASVSQKDDSVCFGQCLLS